MKLEQIISTAIKNGASDIHLTPGTPPVIRCSGELLRIGDEKLMPDDTLALAKEIFAINQIFLSLILIFEEKACLFLTTPHVLKAPAVFQKYV